MVECSHAFNDYFALAKPRRFQKPARFFCALTICAIKYFLSILGDEKQCQHFKFIAAPALVAAEKAFTKSGLYNSVGSSWPMPTPHSSNSKFL